MRYIGRIITSGKIDDVSEFIDVTKDTSSIVDNDTRIPTIIIGYSNAQKICGDLNILKKDIGKNLCWTFTKRERRMDYEPDIVKFFSTVSDFVAKCCKYTFVSLMRTGYSNCKKIIELLDNMSKKKVVFATEKMYYIYVPSENEIFGISREELSFIGIQKNKIVNRFTNPSVTLIKEGEFTENRLMKKKYLTPLFYYLKTF